MAWGIGPPHVAVKMFTSRGRAAHHGPRLSRRRELLVRTSGSSRKVETCRARRRLLGGGPFSRKLVGDAPNWSGTRRLASDGLDKGPQSSVDGVKPFSSSPQAYE
jgi:hypothetical protein